VWYTLSSSRST